jgi:sedoheptulokinase
MRCKMKFIGLDIGTTTIGGVVLDTDSWAPIGSIVKKNTAWLNSGRMWEKTQDSQLILAIVTEILAELATKYPDIKGIGVTGQMHGIVYLDQRGNAVSPLYTWQDGRGNLIYQDGLTYAQALSGLTGYKMAAGYGLTTHFYNSINRLVPQEAVCLCTIGDYVAMRLAGGKRPVCDSSNAASLGLFDLKNTVFDYGAVYKAGLDPAIFPELTVDSLAIGATATGILVFPALGDNQASFIGAVREADKSLLLNIGTGSQASAFCNDFSETAGIELRPFPGGGYIYVGAPLCGGTSYALLESFFRAVLKMFSYDGPLDLYTIMNQIGNTAFTDNDPLTVSTKFNGIRGDPGGRGSVGNISLTNFTPANLIVGFLRGMAAELLEFYNLFPPAIKNRAAVLVGSGNGVRKNQLLRKILAREFKQDLKIPRHEEEASLGAALLAATGGGYFKDLKAAMRRVVKY